MAEDFLEKWKTAKEKIEKQKWLNSSSEIAVLDVLVSAFSKKPSKGSLSLQEIEDKMGKGGNTDAGIKGLFRKGLLNPYAKLDPRKRRSPKSCTLTQSGWDFIQFVLSCTDYKEVDYCVAVIAKKEHKEVKMCFVKHNEDILFSFPGVDITTSDKDEDHKNAAIRAAEQQTGCSFNPAGQFRLKPKLAKSMTHRKDDKKNENVLSNSFVYYGTPGKDSPSSAFHDWDRKWWSREDQSDQGKEPLNIEGFALDLMEDPNLLKKLRGLF